MKSVKNVVWFADIDLKDLKEVGGKNMSLGEMIRHLSQHNISVPAGFSTTAKAFWTFLEYNDLKKLIHNELSHINTSNLEDLIRCSEKIKKSIIAAKFPVQFEKDIAKFYQELQIRHPSRHFAVAVRSSATAEDLKYASFAGQLETYLSINGVPNVLLAIKKVYASLYNPRAIGYRSDMGLSHDKIAVAAGIQCMIRSDKGSSGVMFTLDPESGFQDVVVINASYGLGEAIVQGAVNPDEFYIHKPKLIERYPNPIIRKNLGSKEIKIINTGESTIEKSTKTMSVEPALRHQFSLSDEDALMLAQHAISIEKHYKKPMDIEWGKDGETGGIFILQARPVTVKAYTDPKKIDTYHLKEKSNVLLSGIAIGQKITNGRTCVINNAGDLSAFKTGHILVTDITDPSWEPVMKQAIAIVTNRGGRTCHAAIVARELGIPAVVGCGNATQVLDHETETTIDCLQGAKGFIYEGSLPYEMTSVHLKDLSKCPVKINMNIGNPNLAFQSQFLPNSGVGLARLEFIIGAMIGIHPNLVIDYPTIPSKLKDKVDELSRGYSNPKAFYINKLAEGIGTIAAAFWPKPVIVRLSDFKSNEYRELLGGDLYEPIEENPMIGWRGACRYITPTFMESFNMECQALRYVREKMGLTNVEIMIPFVRTIDECQQVIDLLAMQGLKRGLLDLRIIMMCEIPSNALNAAEFLKYVDGYSIGSNDMTQLVLGMDRDSQVFGHSFDERDPAVKAILRMAIQACKNARKPIGICGQAPSDYLDFATWLVKEGITSLSLNPDSIVKTWIALSK